MESARGLSAWTTGLVFLPMFAVGVVVSTLTSRRPKVRLKLITGAVFQIVACSLLLVVHADTAIWFLVGDGIMFGIPQGLVNLAI